MKVATRKRWAWALGVLGAGLLLLAGSTWLGWRVNSSSGAFIAGYRGMLRADSGTGASSTPPLKRSFITTVTIVYRAHPLEVRVFRASAGYVLEVGSVILAGRGWSVWPPAW